MPILKHSDHPVVAWTFDRLHTAIESRHLEPTCRTVAAARFKFANLVRQEGDLHRAQALYTDALAECDPMWTEHASILNNRGIVRHQLGEADTALMDYTRTIESTASTAEMRACSLNNRADIFDERGEFDAAIADRSAMLELSGTTYNRRFIALARRARALRKQGRLMESYADIDKSSTPRTSQ